MGALQFLTELLTMMHSAGVLIIFMSLSCSLCCAEDPGNPPILPSSDACAFGSLSIVNLSGMQMSGGWESNTGMVVSFDIAPSGTRPCTAGAAFSALVFLNSELVGECHDMGPCSVDVMGLPHGFFLIQIAVVSPNNALAPEIALGCATKGSIDGICHGMITFTDDKVNLHDVTTLLSPSLSMKSLFFTLESDRPVDRPAGVVVLNDYAVNDKGDMLSDPILSSNCTEVVIVSPLLPVDLNDFAKNVRTSNWTLSVAEVISTQCSVHTDRMHTFKIRCRVPESAGAYSEFECAPGTGIHDVQMFRDGIPVWEQRRRVLVPPSPHGDSTGRRVEICTMVRNEAQNIVEWIEYHLMTGASLLVVYLHLTVDATARILEPYVAAGVVEVRAWDFDWTQEFVRVQTHAFNDCSARGAASHQPPAWVAFTDPDEFLVPVMHAPVHQHCKGGNTACSLGAILGRGALESALERAWLGSGGNASVLKMAWLQFSGRSEGHGLTFQRYRWHEDRYQANPWIHDAHSGKVVVRASHGVHIGASGHLPTYPPDCGFEAALPDDIFIAHYVGRNRAYSILDPRHESEARVRRDNVPGVAQWRLEMMLSLARALTGQLCARDAGVYTEAARLCAASLAAIDEGAG